MATARKTTTAGTTPGKATAMPEAAPSAAIAASDRRRTATSAQTATAVM